MSHEVNEDLERPLSFWDRLSTQEQGELAEYMTEVSKETQISVEADCKSHYQPIPKPLDGDEGLDQKVYVITQVMFVTLSEWQAGVTIDWESAKIKGRAELVQLIKSHAEQYAAEKELIVQKAQLEFLISNVGTVVLRGYGGEEKKEFKALSIEQLNKYKNDVEVQLTNPSDKDKTTC